MRAASPGGAVQERGTRQENRQIYILGGSVRDATTPSFLLDDDRQRGK